MVQTVNWQQRYETWSHNAGNRALREFYSTALPGPETPLADVPLVAMDYETTGLNPRKDGIVSIGLVPFTLERIRCAGALHWVVRPRQTLKNQSVVIHRITHSDIENAPDLSEVLDPLLQALAGKVAVVHYRGIERPFLDVALKARLGEGIQFPVIDTMQIESDQVRGMALPWWKKLFHNPRESVRLADSRVRYGLPDYAPHHALTDALATAELLQAQVAYHFRPDTPVQDLWL